MNLNTTTSAQEQAVYLRTLPSIRDRCAKVYELAKLGKLEYFEYNPTKETDVVAFCEQIIKRDFGTNLASIPPHGRWRHLDAGCPRVEPLVASWKASSNPPDDKEICKRLIDLFLVSVLLDAGAGSEWSFFEKESNQNYSRSEGLGVASVHMFTEGLFSGDKAQPYRVDSQGLSQITTAKTAVALQVNDSNPMVGLDGRTSLLVNLSEALKSSPQLFGKDARPGNMLDFLETQNILEGSIRRVHISSLWHVLIEGLALIWPARTSLAGLPLGDVWPCSALKSVTQVEAGDLVPFHKLTGWITYSLVEPIEKILQWTFEGKEDMTGLPEYRNGGLLVDFGVLTIRPNILSPSFYPDLSTGVPRLPPSHPAIVEWRAMTIIELDRIADALRHRLGLSSTQLTLAQVLESATWKGGREIAKQRRPQTGGPPIDIESDGTVF